MEFENLVTNLKKNYNTLFNKICNKDEKMCRVILHSHIGSPENMKFILEFLQKDNFSNNKRTIKALNKYNTILEDIVVNNWLPLEYYIKKYNLNNYKFYFYVRGKLINTPYTKTIKKKILLNSSVLKDKDYSHMFLETNKEDVLKSTKKLIIRIMAKEGIRTIYKIASLIAKRKNLKINGVYKALNRIHKENANLSPQVVAKYSNYLNELVKSKS